MMRYNSPEAIESLGLTLVLNRVKDYCTMSASVSGDLGGHTFGDVAYFNTAAYPVKKGMMVGTIGETQTHESVDGFGTVDVSREGALDLAAQLGLISEDEAEQAAENVEDGVRNQQEAQAESGGFAESAEQQLRADNPIRGGQLRSQPGRYQGPTSRPSTDVGAAAMFSGAFTMSISGRVGQANNEHRIVVGAQPLAMATVGISDKGVIWISFELDRGQPSVDRRRQGHG